MPNLTETAHKARQVIKFGGFGFVGLLFIWLVGSNAIRIWRIVNPAPPPPPSEDFGRLEPIQFPQSKELSYDLQTPTGEIEEFTTQIKVFYSPALRSSFLDEINSTYFYNSNINEHEILIKITESMVESIHGKKVPKYLKKW